MKYVIFIPDGSSDYPIDELGGKTPLEVANTPNIDALASKGIGGFTNNVPDKFTPGSDVANMSIFGYDPDGCYTGRGPLEAGSMGIETTPYDIIFRCNTITEEDGKIEDFNAGHITSEEAEVLMEALNEYFNEKYDDFKGKFYPGISYRHLFVYSCENDKDTKILDELETMPPHDIVGEDIEENTLWNDEIAIEIKKIMKESEEILENHEINKKRVAEGKKPANMVWLWGQGTTPALPDFKETYGLDGAVITGVDLLKGIGIFAGLDIIEVPGATGFFDTDYKAKGEYAIEGLKDHDLLLIHVEAPDEAGHAQDIEEKVRAIERIDEFIVGPVLDSLEGQDYKAAILPDHPTPISVGTHTRDNVPIVVYSTTADVSDDVERFTEKEAEKGSFAFKEGFNLINRLINDDFN
ncbi:MAG: cofactor-independent phosphoglycerate mutase [Methanobrevibacter sp.]|uniref:cofactor-independent phosphoglycerate mutase n=1 Tax=Methanobrevibacter sp. TaxID=66852 RepID=UPI0026E06BF5|nr:cofactor-independent phosphoglycerate mutase [Methanobrevibacter sp.]MDO5849179.1 cofactor-independent phosphoglycerate mutase [Methanobrevibacter sp.]